MAATVDTVARMLTGTPLIISETQLSALTADEPEDIAHGGVAGLAPRKVEMEILTRPTDGSDIRMWHDNDNDNTTNNTCRLRFYTSGGGSLTGAVVRLRFEFAGMKSGGLDPPA
jgi:hypothetical protein